MIDDFEEKNEGKTTSSEQEQADTTSNPNNDSSDDKNNISSDLIRGHINTIILRSLYERDKYGYEIINDIERKSHNQYTLKQPTLYSALKRLENQGYIIAYWKTDEVSSGGRRKYFTLTDSGREITEKNLAEWEYSRTIIDNLISDRSFDFSQPAPTPVDFTILRSSVSRVPIVKDVEDNESEVVKEVTEQAYQAIIQNEVNDEPAPTPAPTSLPQPTEQVQAPQQATQISHDEEEARIRAHENYLRLISEPVKQTEKEPVEDIVPNSNNVSADKLLYNIKPDTERDYKNLINNIYNKALSNGVVTTTYSHREERTTVKRKPYAGSTLIIDRGKADGVRISPSYEYDSRNSYATKTTYNKGLTFLMCSGVVLFFLLIEFIFCLIFKDSLRVSVAYPIVILLIGLVQFAVFGALVLKGYGANCTKPMSHSYLSKSIIFTIILILIICISSFLFHINFSLASDIMRLIVIPSLTVLNIVIFTVCFRLLIER